MPVKIHNHTTPGMATFEIMTFPGGEPHVHAQFCRPSDEYVIEAHVQSFNDIGQILVANDFLRRHNVERVTLYIPYLPGARQDRGAPLTAKVYADLINAQRFDQVICVDPHSDVMPALLDDLTIVSQAEAFSEIVPGSGNCVFPRLGFPSNTTLIVPDAGAAKRVEQFAHRYGYTEIVQAGKHRDFALGTLTGFTCPPIPKSHPNVVVLDDICDGGGTFLGLAQQMRYDDGTIPERVDMTLMVTHGIFSKGVEGLLNSFGQIICTDSFADGFHATSADPRSNRERWPDIWLLPITKMILERYAT